MVTKKEGSIKGVWIAKVIVLTHLVFVDDVMSFGDVISFGDGT